MSTTDNGHEPSENARPQRREVVVIGGRQAGLAIGCFLSQQGRARHVADQIDALRRTAAGSGEAVGDPRRREQAEEAA